MPVRWMPLCHILIRRFTGGTVHKEIFSFDRVEDGPYKGKEWDSIVKPVIEKWGMTFHCPHVTTYVNRENLQVLL